MHITIQPTDPDDPMALACLAQYFALLVARIPDLSPQMFPLPDPDARSYRPPSGTFLLALSGQTPVGCVSLRPLTTVLAEVKRLWIAPAARGQGLARRLMQTVEDHARSLGHTALTLDTNEHLPEAIALYTNTGWHPVPPYTDPPATHWFGKPL
ncbi:MAG: GNAT family N-acetyltransferase [Candidatus Saccharibacteria bacterium]|nr:GNAT family N-acetyltransferase [Pseudorhodobacter sp.]